MTSDEAELEMEGDVWFARSLLYLGDSGAESGGSQKSHSIPGCKRRDVACLLLRSTKAARLFLD